MTHPKFEFHPLTSWYQIINGYQCHKWDIDIADRLCTFCYNESQNGCIYCAYILACLG